MIRNATLIAALSLTLMLPLTARAQTAQPPDVTLPAPASGEGWAFHPSHWVAVGAGGGGGRGRDGNPDSHQP